MKAFQKSDDEIHNKNELNNSLLREFESVDIFQKLPIGIAIIDPDTGKFNFINSNFAQILGYTEEELLKKTFQSITHPEDLNKNLELHDKLHRGETDSYHIEKRNVRKDGTIIWVELTVTRLKDKENKRQFHLGAIFDLSLRKSAEQQLKASEELFRTVITNAPISIFATDEKGIFTLHEGKAIERVEMKAGDNVGASAYELFAGLKVIEHNGMVTTGKSILDRVSNGEYLSGITELNGVVFDNQFAPIWDKNGKVKGLLGVATDITEQKRMEKERLAFESRYRMLFNEIDEGFCIIEMLFDENEKPADYRFLEVNPAFEKQTGLKNAQGKRMRELKPQHEKHWFEIYGRIALTGVSERFVNRADQLHRWYDVYAFRFGKSENRQVAILFNDITERKEWEEELRYRAEIAAQISDGVALIDSKDGRILHTSRRYEEMFGYKKGKLLGKHSTILNANDPHQNAEETYLIAMNSLRENGKWKGVVHNVKKDGTLFWTQASVSSIVHPKFGKVWLSVQMDVSERIEAEVALKKNEKLLTAMVSNISDVIAIIDQHGINQFKSANVEKWFGWKPDELIGQNTFDNIHPDDQMRIKSNFYAMLSQPGQIYNDECRYRCKNGSYKWIELTAVNQTDNPAIDGVLVNYRDISQRKKAREKLIRHENELKLLSSELIIAQEKEKKMLAIELHDEIGQALTAMKINLSTVLKNIPDETNHPACERIKETDLLLDSIISRIHDISLNLHPAILEILGFAATIKSYAQQFEKRTGINVRMIDNCKTNLNTEQEINLFRIVQEALTNVAKHADAKNIEICLNSGKKWFKLTIKDDGNGFASKKGETSGNSHGIGLIGMNERVGALEGKFRIRSSPGKGTKIKIKVPLHGNEK